MKVAPSTSALPAGSSSRFKVVGQDAVFDRAEQRRDRAEEEERDEQERKRMHREAGTAITAAADLRKLQPLRHHRLVEAVGELAAEAGEEEERRDEDGAGERDQRPRRRRPPILKRIRKTSAFFRKLSLKAEKNCVQKSGAKRLEVIRGRDMDVDPGQGAAEDRRAVGLLW